MCTGCLDTLTSAHSLGVSAVVEDTERSCTTTAAYNKDDYSVVNRFESTSTYFCWFALGCCCI